MSEERCQEIFALGGAKGQKLSKEEYKTYCAWKARHRRALFSPEENEAFLKRERERGKIKRQNPVSKAKAEIRQKIWAKNHPEKRAAARRRHYLKYQNEYRIKGRSKKRFKTFGLTDEDFARMLNEQESRCIGCKTATPKTIKGKIPWSIDHSHKTGKIRGILCSSCNLTLGHSQESIERLEGLIEYIKRFKDT